MLSTMDTNAKDKNEGQKPLITYPAEFRILIQGRLDIGWSDRMAGMSITIMGGRGLTPQTTLRGEVVDQSALLGILNTLHDLGFALLDLKYLSNDLQLENR